MDKKSDNYLFHFLIVRMSMKMCVLARIYITDGSVIHNITVQ